MEKECALADCHSPATEGFSALVTHADHMDHHGDVFAQSISVEIKVCKSCHDGILRGTIVIPPGGLRVKEFTSTTK